MSPYSPTRPYDIARRQSMSPFRRLLKSRASTLGLGHSEKHQHYNPAREPNSADESKALSLADKGLKAGLPRVARKVASSSALLSPYMRYKRAEEERAAMASRAGVGGKEIGGVMSSSDLVPAADGQLSPYQDGDKSAVQQDSRPTPLDRQRQGSHAAAARSSTVTSSNTSPPSHRIASQSSGGSLSNESTNTDRSSILIHTPPRYQLFDKPMDDEHEFTSASSSPTSDPAAVLTALRSELSTLPKQKLNPAPAGPVVAVRESSLVDEEDGFQKRAYAIEESRIRDLSKDGKIAMNVADLSAALRRFSNEDPEPGPTPCRPHNRATKTLKHNRTASHHHHHHHHHHIHVPTNLRHKIQSLEAIKHTLRNNLHATHIPLPERTILTEITHLTSHLRALQVEHTVSNSTPASHPHRISIERRLDHARMELGFHRAEREAAGTYGERDAFRSDALSSERGAAQGYPGSMVQQSETACRSESRGGRDQGRPETRMLASGTMVVLGWPPGAVSLYKRRMGVWLGKRPVSCDKDASDGGREADEKESVAVSMPTSPASLADLFHIGYT
ncbi:hypothetical protein LTR62_002038 [Meristemomyces frigidus]|uniref:Uncharacterized protein n=1 Tax=Meristemomyces frigidus TaxID=1508187 RepID=A0AAN7TMW7_9PEZI|nr:hypothetical protein LTR62_002038 [Meristemomyces frigidus]